MAEDDHLDDLFGALDGDTASSKVEETSTTAATTSTTTQSQDDDGDAKALLTAVMATSSSIRKDPAKRQADDETINKENSARSSGNGKTKDGASSAAEKKAPEIIATGTSHDKSIRSYSAIPKTLFAPDKEPRLAEPAKTYPFTLDPFQQKAIEYIDQDESVLVAAHTSAGKTAVAEYAVAKALKKGQRVVYTSPIKALSNQKFRDLQEEFGSGEVGLMTGDITINPTATCLVMTTEILRSMLYRGSEIMREVAWVIYDEVHYMRDSERGVVWEESIILLPHKVKFVFLSATIPNASQFVDWIANIHHQPCHVVYTNYRPVPLQHYIFPRGGEGLHLVVDERGRFREANFQRAMASMQSGQIDAAIGESLMSSGGDGGRKRKRGGPNNKKNASTDLYRIVKLIMERNLNPVIVFSFSKKDCERYALELNKEDYTDDVEKDLITQVYNNAIESLGEDDRQLPQVQALLPLLKKGIGIHHGGLLPILKEIVEILFSEGLIKALFATETFSIGINMPAKTVVFTNTRKWDGQDFRFVTSGEYIQMSGRAGRRGKDDRGVVIQMLDEKMEPNVCKGILYGDPDPLNSSYRISYNMLLNMMRVEEVDPEYLLRSSFYQFQRETDAPALIQQAEDFENEASEIDIGTPEQEKMASEYYQIDQQLFLTKRKMIKIMQKPEYVVPYLQNPGRFLDVAIEGDHYGWGVLTSYKRKAGTGTAGSAGKLANATGDPVHVLEVLLFCVDRHFDEASASAKDEKAKAEDAEGAGMLWRGSAKLCRPYRPGQDDEALCTMRIFTISLSNIQQTSAVRVFVPTDVHSPESRKLVATRVREVQRRFPDGIPLLDPFKDMGIKEEDFTTLLKRAEALKERLASHPMQAEGDEKEDQIQKIHAFQRKAELLEKAKALKDEARGCQTLSKKEDLKKMKRVLRKLGHVDASGVIQTKGRTACEINTANELVVVELMFTGVFNDLAVEQCVALLSCMTYDERNAEEDEPLKSYLANPFKKLQECARTVARASIACKIELDEEEFLGKFNPGMMEAVFAWCKGAKFVEVQKLTGSFEGTTIRTLRRLEELVRQLTSASKAIGNHELETKFEKGSELIKRDIVFCSSLYL